MPAGNGADLSLADTSATHVFFRVTSSYQQITTHFYGVLIFFVLLPTPFSPLPRMTSSIQRPQLWLRCETKPFERRAVLTPTIALKLIDAGFEIFVEGDEQRIFDDIEYEKCVISSYPLIMYLELTQFFLVLHCL